MSTTYPEPTLSGRGGSSAPRQLAFHLAAAACAFAAAFHLAAMAVPAFSGMAYPASYPLWRHVGFFIVDASFAWLFLLRPRWLFAPYVVLTLQVVNGHGRAARSLWRDAGKADWISIVSVIGVVLGLGLLTLDWRDRQPGASRTTG